MLLPNPVKESNRHIFVAAEKKIPRVRIETRQSSLLVGQRIIVAIDSWPRTSRYPLGHFVRALGKDIGCCFFKTCIVNASVVDPE